MATRITRLARWALIGAAVLMGWALLATVWSTHQGVQGASDTLIRGRADMFYDAVKYRTGLRRPTSAELATLVEEFRDDGLAYLAALGEDGQIFAEAGTARQGVTADDLRRSVEPTNEPKSIGDRVHIAFRRPVRGQPPAPKPELATWLVMEFEPRMADHLRSAARRTLGVGALAAVGFLCVAIGLMRWFLKREILERQLAHERRLASVGQMSAVLAHEIRNPLASLKGNAQLLARALPAGEAHRAKAERVVDEAVRLESLTNDLLEFARAGELRRSDVDPAALLSEAIAAVDPARIELDTVGAPERWSLDAERVRQVLVNLLENAVQAADAPVRASVSRERGLLLFRVRDHGPGVPPEDVERIFEPFFTRRTQGTGLGLAVARRFVELHGGRIRVTNADDGGAIFEITIPEGN